MELIGNIFNLLSFTLVFTGLVLILMRVFYEVGYDLGLPPGLRNLVYNGDSEKTFQTNSTSTDMAKFPLLTVVMLIIGTRTAIFALTYIVETAANKIKPGSFPEYWKIWFIQDSPHYICVAENGYRSSGYESIFIVFYPLYPYLIKALNVFFNNYFLSGLIISNTCFILACYYLYRLVVLEFGDEKLSLRAVIFLILFPFSFFFNIIYTESLFLALSAMVFYYARKNYWFIAGICGLLAALTKNQGMLLFIPIVMEIFLSKDFVFFTKNKMPGKASLYLTKSLPCSLLPPMGFGVYLLINKWVTGDWFKFLEFQRDYWGNKMWLFSFSIKQSFHSFFSHDLIFVAGTYVPQLLFFFMTAVLILFFIGKVRVTYTLFPLIYLIFSYSPTALLSGPRYISGMIPIYIFLSYLSNRSNELKPLLFTVSVILLFFFSLTFVGGGTY